jgi:aspartate carbamoyltransferase catalytic subunit
MSKTVYIWCREGKEGSILLKGKSLLEPMDFTTEELEELFLLSDEIIEAPERYAKACEGKLLATLFYEPSTRTRFSFEAAMLRLGGQVIGFSEPNSSSVSKGESISDTIRTVACYADMAVMRHPKEGAPKVAAACTDMPVVNAGDGGHQHPTQTLTDLLTIRREKGGFENITVGLCGDLKFGRTVHSLIKALSRYKNVSFIMISPEELKIPDYVRKEVLIKNNIPFEETGNMQEALPKLDVLYMTRVQRERFFNEEDYVRLKDRYILDGAKMKLAKGDMMVLHPLPRVNEIAIEVDSDPRALYFKQAQYGMYVRMALIMGLLGIKG